MITIYSGTVGSGKSLHAAETVRFALDHGRPVLANWRIAPDAPTKHPELFTYMENDEITPTSLLEYTLSYWQGSGKPLRENHVTWCFDECHNLWNARSWNDKKRQELVKVFSQSRKLGVRVIFIAQSDQMIDTQFRKLVNTRVIHKKVSEKGMVGWLISLPFAGRLFLRVEVDQQTNQHISAETYIARRKDMAMYDTFETLSLGEFGELLERYRQSGI